LVLIEHLTGTLDPSNLEIEVQMILKLVLEDGSVFPGYSFGHLMSTAGEVVFNTGMVGYPESLTDPSYSGQILVLTYPLIGNYGIPPLDMKEGLPENFESERIHIRGLVVAENSVDYSHWNSVDTISGWLTKNKIPGISGIDTRSLTKKLREKGTMLGKIVKENDRVEFYDPSKTNVVSEVSVREPIFYQAGPKRVAVIDCGCKASIIRHLIQLNVSVLRVPWNYEGLVNEHIDGLLISNGPGDPRQCAETIKILRNFLQRDVPILGICLGNQILSLAAGADTYKLKFGHRSQNQPCIRVGTKRCYITSQNHGYAVASRSLSEDWVPWFFNANDGTNEGVRHRTKPFRSVQFHPEAAPGPTDTRFLFEEFVKLL
jgi:carbamoyl-phosphate synthase small subunit